MSFIGYLFKCCQAPKKTKSELIITQEGPSQSSFIKRVPQSKPNSVKDLHRFTHHKNPNLKLILPSSFRSNTNVGNQMKKILTISPDYIPANELEKINQSIDNCLRLIIFDKLGDIFNNQKIIITTQGVEIQGNYISKNEKEAKTIKSINYFWLKDKMASSVINKDVEEESKDYVLNLSCDLLSNIVTYLFIIFYIKEINIYKIKFNNSLHQSILAKNIFVKISNDFPQIILNETRLTLGEVQFQINILNQYMIEIININQKKQYGFHAITQSTITIGRSEKCSLSFPDELSLSEYHTTIFYDMDNKTWMLHDGVETTPSDTGSWFFSSHPIPINNGMIIRMWNKEIMINYL